MSEDLDKADMTFLLGRPEFVRLLWRVIQISGLFSPATDGSIDRHLAYAEGRRNLGLDILAMAEQGQPASHPNGQPILTILQTLREEASKPQEKPKRERYDRNRELDTDD